MLYPLIRVYCHFFLPLLTPSLSNADLLTLP